MRYTILLIALAFVACKKKDPEPAPAPKPTKSDVTFIIHSAKKAEVTLNYRYDNSDTTFKSGTGEAGLTRTLSAVSDKQRASLSVAHLQPIPGDTNRIRVYVNGQYKSYAFADTGAYVKFFDLW